MRWPWVSRRAFLRRMAFAALACGFLRPWKEDATLVVETGFVYVDGQQGSDLLGDGSQEAPFRSLEAGVAEADRRGGGLVRIAPGVYDFSSVTLPRAFYLDGAP